MVTGRMIEEDQEYIAIDGGSIEVVQEFPYLGSIIESSGKTDVDRRIAQASKAFGALRKSVFLDKNLSLRERCTMLVSCLCCYMVQNTGPLSASMRRG